MDVGGSYGAHKDWNIVKINAFPTSYKVKKIDKESVLFKNS